MTSTVLASTLDVNQPKPAKSRIGKKFDGVISGPTPTCGSVSEYRAKLKKFLLARLCDDLLVESRNEGRQKYGRVPSCHGRTDPDTGEFYFPWIPETMIIPPDPSKVTVSFPLASDVKIQCGFPTDPKTTANRICTQPSLDSGKFQLISLLHSGHAWS
jgi:hypothetical protein